VFQRGRADKQRWRNGFATDADLIPLVKASDDICKAPIYIDDVPCHVEQLCAKARQMHRQHGIELFIVDYIQLLYSQRDYKGDRVQELAYISRLLTLTAKALNVPFIVIAQMNRDAEKEPNREPRLSDLKDSGAIEQDADVVAFLYAPKLKEKAEEKYEEQMLAEYPAKGGGTDWSRAPKRINLLIAKYRNGPTGPCELLFHKSCMHFEDYAKWQKAKGYKAPAAGEPKQEALISDEDVP
jgi:replicative DNA helicase